MEWEISPEEVYLHIKQSIALLPTALLVFYTLSLDTSISALIIGAIGFSAIVSFLDSETTVDTYILFGFLTTTIFLILVLTTYLFTKLFFLIVLIWMPISRYFLSTENTLLEYPRTSEFIIVIFSITGLFLFIQISLFFIPITSNQFIQITTYIFYNYAITLSTAYFFTSSIYPLIYPFMSPIIQEIKSIKQIHIINIGINMITHKLRSQISGNNDNNPSIIALANSLKRPSKIILISIVFLVLSFLLIPYTSAGKLLYMSSTINHPFRLNTMRLFVSSYFTSYYLAPTNFSFGLFLITFLYLKPRQQIESKTMLLALILVCIATIFYFIFHLQCPTYTVTATNQLTITTENTIEWVINGFHFTSEQIRSCYY